MNQKSKIKRTFPQKCLYHPQVSQAFHSPAPQLIRLCHTFSWITSLTNSFLFGSLGIGTRHAANPSNVRERTDFCSLVRESNALTAVVRAGDSTWSSVGGKLQFVPLDGGHAVHTPGFASASTSIDAPLFAPSAFALARFSSSSFLNAITLFLAIITRPLALSNAAFNKSHCR